MCARAHVPAQVCVCVCVCVCLSVYEHVSVSHRAALAVLTASTIKVTTTTSALILLKSCNCNTQQHFTDCEEGQSHKTMPVHKPQPFGRERRAEADSNRGPSAYQPNALPLGQTGSLGPAGTRSDIYTHSCPTLISTDVAMGGTCIPIKATAHIRETYV